MKKRKMGPQFLAWTIIILFIVLTYFIIKPYIIAIISAFILAYLSRPIYLRIQKKLGKKTAAAISLIIISLIVIIPLLIVIGGVTEQAYTALKEDRIKPFLDKISSNPLIEEFGINLDELRTKGLNMLIILITGAIKQAPLFLISLVIMLWGMYYILINWDFIAKELKSYLPFENKDETVKEIDTATKSIVHGTLIIALLELVVAGLGFYILGVQAYLLLAALIAILAFIPGLGPIAVWLPAAIFYLFIGEIGTSIGVLVLGIIISIVIETFIAGKIIEKKANINPLIRFIGVLGGVVIFGVFGFIIGPLILIYTLKILENLKSD